MVLQSLNQESFVSDTSEQLETVLSEQPSKRAAAFVLGAVNRQSNPGESTSLLESAVLSPEEVVSNRELYADRRAAVQWLKKFYRSPDELIALTEMSEAKLEALSDYLISLVPHSQLMIQRQRTLLEGKSVSGVAEDEGVEPKSVRGSLDKIAHRLTTLPDDIKANALVYTAQLDEEGFTPDRGREIVNATMERLSMKLGGIDPVLRPWEITRLWETLFESESELLQTIQSDPDLLERMFAKSLDIIQVGGAHPLSKAQLNRLFLMLSGENDHAVGKLLGDKAHGIGGRALNKYIRIMRDTGVSLAQIFERVALKDAIAYAEILQAIKKLSPEENDEPEIVTRDLGETAISEAIDRRHNRRLASYLSKLYTRVLQDDQGVQELTLAQQERLAGLILEGIGRFSERGEKVLGLWLEGRRYTEIASDQSISRPYVSKIVQRIAPSPILKAQDALSKLLIYVKESDNSPLPADFWSLRTPSRKTKPFESIESLEPYEPYDPYASTGAETYLLHRYSQIESAADTIAKLSDGQRNQLIVLIEANKEKREADSTEHLTSALDIVLGVNQQTAPASLPTRLQESGQTNRFSEVDLSSIDKIWKFIESISDMDERESGEAFGRVWSIYGPQVFRFIRNKIENYADAEDLAADVSLRLLVAIRKGRVEQRGVDFGTYCFKVAMNVIIDRSKLARVKREVSLEGLIKEPAIDLPKRSPEAAIVAQHERIDTLLPLTKAMRSLTEGQRKVIEYRFFDGLTSNQVAEIMQKEVGAIKVLQFRALRRLKSLLAHQFPANWDEVA